MGEKPMPYSDEAFRKRLIEMLPWLAAGAAGVTAAAAAGYGIHRAHGARHHHQAPVAQSEPAEALTESLPPSVEPLDSQIESTSDNS